MTESIARMFFGMVRTSLHVDRTAFLRPAERIGLSNLLDGALMGSPRRPPCVRVRALTPTRRVLKHTA